MRFEISAEKEKLWFLHQTFTSFSTSTAFEQKNAAPGEITTPGYTPIVLNIGGNISANNQLISLTLSADNILDTKYIDHLSTLKRGEPV